jgi:hypothetical protein
LEPKLFPLIIFYDSTPFLIKILIVFNINVCIYIYLFSPLHDGAGIAQSV